MITIRVTTTHGSAPVTVEDRAFATDADALKFLKYVHDNKMNYIAGKLNLPSYKPSQILIRPNSTATNDYSRCPRPKKVYWGYQETIEQENYSLKIEISHG